MKITKNFFSNSKLAFGILSMAFLLLSDIAFSQTLDAGITGIVQPVGQIRNGVNRTLTIRVRNYGSRVITKLSVGWKLNGGGETVVTQSVTIPVATNANQIASSSFTVSSAYPDALNNNVEIYIKLVNDETDINTLNDTLKAKFQSPISGTKTIGIGTADYKTFAEAVNAMRYNGVDGNITFKVKAGSYSNDFIEIANADIYQPSGPKTYTFESLSGKRDVILLSEAALQTTVKINSLDRVTINNIRIINRNIVTGIGVQAINGADRLTISNCEITVDSISNSKGFVGVLAGALGTAPGYALTNTTATSRHFTISNNKISGGYYGVAFSGLSSIRDTGLVVEKNTIQQSSYYGVYVNFAMNAKINQNKVTFRPSADFKSVGYFLQNINTASPGNIEITRNYVTAAGQYGIYMNSVVGTGAPTNRYVNIYNNMIAGGFYNNFSQATFSTTETPTGLYMNSSGFANVYFNSINMDAPTKTGFVDNTTSFYLGGTNVGAIRVFNNIFNNENKGYAYYNNYALATSPVTLSDNNDLFVANLDSNSNPITGFSWWAGAARLTLRDLIASTNANVNLQINKSCISKDPLFFSSSDLHTLSMDLNEKGSTYPLTESPIDYDGELRDQVKNPDIGADEFGPGGADYAIVGITPDVFKFNKPTPWNITVRYQGSGSGNTTLYFLYKIDGVDQITNVDDAIPLTFTKLTANMKSETKTVPIINFINRANYQAFKLTVYLVPGSNPGDTRAYNDSIEMDVCVGLEGTFTIDPRSAPSLTNFTSFQETYDYLKCGVSGPTIFEIADGTYDEQITLWKIRNSSTTNNIVFKSKNNVFATRLTYRNGTSENHATVLLNNAQYITLRDLTIENRSTNNGTCIQLSGNSKFNIIRNNIIKVDSTLTPYPTPTDGTLIPILASRLGTLVTTASYAQNATSNTIMNNTILGGYYGILMYGRDADKRDVGNIIQGNTITSFHKAGIYMEFSDTKLLNNVIVGKYGMDNSATAIFAKSMGDKEGVSSNEISGNKIYDVTHQGIYLQECYGKKVVGAKKSTFILSNNMIGGGFTQFFSTITGAYTSGITIKKSQAVSILHNTVLMDAPRTSTITYSAAVARCMIVDSSNADIEAFNNILYSTNGAIALEYYTKLRQGNVKTGLSSSENNLYYTKYKSLNTPLYLILRLGNTQSNPQVTTYYGFSQLSQSPLVALNNFKKANGNTTRDRKSLALPLIFESLPYDLHTYDLTVESKGGFNDVLDDFDKQPRKTKTPDIGCDEFTVPNYDLDVNKVLNPLFSSLKPNKIVVKLRNRGRYPLDNVQVALKYTVRNDDIGFIAESRDTVTLRMKKTGDTQIYTFKNRVQVPSRGNYNICVEKVANWIPQDTVYVNDKACKDVCTGIEGEYYIGFDTQNPLPGTDTNRYYKTIQLAFDRVECGIADYTYFNVNPANSPYTERVIIPKYLVNLDSPILTLRPYNTISNTAVVIQNTTEGDQNNKHYVIRFNGSNLVRLQNLNIKNNSAAYGSGIHITRNAVNNIIEGCKIEVNSTITTLPTARLFYPIAFTSTNKLDITDNNSFAKNGSSNRVTRNELVGGYAGIGMLGASTVEFDIENVIDSNMIKDYYQFGIYTNNNTVKRIGFNSLIPRATSAASCVSISYNIAGEGGIINANKIINSKQIGIKIYGVDGFMNDRLIVSNNWITHNFGNSIADTSSAILVKRSNNIGLYYNSIRYNGFVAALNFAKDSAIIVGQGGEPDQKVYFTPTNVQVRNNIVYVDSVSGGPQKPYAIYFNSSDPSSEFEHNAYYTGYASKFAYFHPRDQKTFPVWQLNTAKDLTSYPIPKTRADTLFVSGFDLNLRDTTIFDKKGIVVAGINRDFNNRKRSPRVTDIGSIEYEKQDIDVSILNIINKKAIYGLNTFSVTILNEGNNDLSSKSIALEYSVDSGKNWIGRQTVNLNELKSRYDEQILDFNLKYPKNDFHVIPLCVRIAPDVRLTGDTITKYESICKDLCVGLEKGEYTIGKNGSGADFNSFQEAVVALICGFDSSIVFKVHPGVYNERVTIPDLATSPDTTVTFESMTGNAEDVTVEYANTTDVPEHHVIQLNGARYMIFRNLTISSKAKARASGIHIADTAKNITVENCIFRFDSTSNINTLVGVLASSNVAFTDPASASNNIIRNNQFYGGSFGVRLLGIKDNAFSGANKIVGNKFRNVYTAAIDIFYSQIDSVSKNDIYMRDGNIDGVGINIYGALTDFMITSNKVVNAQNIGIAIDSCRTISRGLIANNMVAGGFVSDGLKNDCGFLLKSTGAFPTKGVNSSGFIDIINNSVLYDGADTAAAAFKLIRSNSLNLFNNIFANYGEGYAIKYVYDPDGVDVFNEANTNLLYTHGALLANWNGVICDSLAKLGQQDQGNSPFNVGKSPGEAGEFDPMFRSNKDLHTNTVKLNGVGTKYDLVTEDIDGDLRNPSTPDVGCDEYFVGKDLGVSEIITPGDLSSFKDTVRVIVRVKNYGANNNTVKVKYTFDGVLIDSAYRLVTPDLKIDSSIVMVFSKKFSTRQAGPHIIKAYTEIKKIDINNKFVNDDFNNLNDTATITVISKDTSDIGVSYFAEPLNGVAIKALTPVKVGVTNYGNLEAKSFKIYLKVNNRVKEVLNINTPLNGKQTKEFTFNYKMNPDSAVYFDVCATTTLYDDVLEANDSTCILVLTVPVGVSNNVDNAILSVHPNPTSSELHFVMNLKKESDVNINIYDLTGRLVKNATFPAVASGKQTLDMNFDELTEGTYLFVMFTNEKKYNGRFVIIK